MKRNLLATHQFNRFLRVLFSLIALTSMFFSATSAYAGTAIVATKTAAVVPGAGNDLDGDGKADPGDTVEYTVTINNVSGADQSGVSYDDNPDPNTTYVAGSLTASPVANDDTFPITVIGNISINSAALSTPFSVTDNDFLGLNPTATISAYDAVTLQGGQVVMTTSGADMGKFTYNPPPGFEGTDTFTYTLSDNARASSATANRTATVNIRVSGMIWFIDNNAPSCTTLAGGCGRLSNPFSSLAAFNTLNNGVANNPAANDNIFIYESSNAYSGAVTLLNGQKLIGQDATTSLSAITGLTPPVGNPSFPTMNSVNGTVTNLTSTVTLNINTTVRGLQINSTTSTGLTDPAGAISGVSVSDVSVATTTGTAVSLSNDAGTFLFNRISSNGAANGISLTNTTGAFNVKGDGTNSANGSGGMIQNSVGIGGAIALSNVQNISLSSMNLPNNTYSAISGSGVNTISLTGCQVTNNGRGVTPAADGIMLTDTTGALTLTNDSVTGSGNHNVNITASSGSTAVITSLAVTNGSYSSSAGGTGFLVQTHGSAAVNTALFSGVTFSNNFADGLNLIQNDNGSIGNGSGAPSTGTATVTGSTFINNSTGASFAGGGGTNGTGNTYFRVLNNIFTGQQSNALNFVSGASSQGGIFQALVSGNTIGNASVANSGSAMGSGIVVTTQAKNALVTITNNTIRQAPLGRGIDVEALGPVQIGLPATTLDLQVMGNDVNPQDSTGFPLFAIYVAADNQGSPSLVRAAIHGNTVPTTSACDTSCTSSTSMIWYEAVNGASGTLYNFSGSGASVSAEISNTNTGTNGKTSSSNSNLTLTSTNPGMVASMDGGPALVNQFLGWNSLADISNSAVVLTVLSHGSTWVNSLSHRLAEWYAGDYLMQHTRLLNGIREIQAIYRAASVLPSTSTVHVAIGSLTNKKSLTIKYWVTINATAALPTGVTQVTNQGTVTYGSGSTELTDDPAVTGVNNPTVVLLDLPDLTLTKSHTGKFYQTQTGAQYTLTVANQGTEHTSGAVTVTDILPTGLTATDATGPGWSCATGVTVVCTRNDTLNAGASYPAIILTTNVAASASASVTNTATVSGGGETKTANDTANDVTLIDPAADLAVTQSVSPALVFAGSNLTYSISFTNNGLASAQNVTFTDDVPANTTFVSASTLSGVGWVVTTPVVGGTGSVIFAKDNVPANETATFQIVVKVDPNTSNGSSISNIATTASSTMDPTPDNNAFTLTAQVITQADLHATQIAPVSATAGANFDYTLVVTNNGPSDAHDVALADSLPAGVSFISQSQTSGPSFTLSNTGNTLNNTITTLSAGATATIQVTVNANANLVNGSTLSNTATVSSTTPDPASDNNIFTTHTNVSTSADLQITQAAPPSVDAGSDFTYTFTITNNGPSDAQSLTLADTLPAGVSFVSQSQTSGPSFILSNTVNNFNDTINTLAVGASAAFQVNVHANADLANASTVSNTATISSATLDPVSGNNFSTATSTVQGSPDLVITKTHSGSFRQGNIGHTYTLTVTNQGAQPSHGTVTVVDTLPTGLNATAIGGTNWTCDPLPVLHCTRSDTLASGNSYEAISLTVDVDNNAPASLTNVATVSGGGEAITNNDTASDLTAIDQVADLTVTKTHTGDFTQGQVSAQYLITVSNNGNGSTVGAVTVVDTLPVGLTATAIGGANWFCDPLPALSCTRGDTLTAGSSYAPITVTVTVAGNTAASVINQAHVSGGGELNTSNNTAEDSSNINVSPSTSIYSQPANPSSSADATLAFTGLGGTAPLTFECQIDGASFSACASPQSYTGLGDGSHTFQVRALDANGVKDAIPARYTWLVDTVAPSTSIVTQPGNPSYISTATFTFSGSDTAGSGVAGFECLLDSGSFAACSSPQSYVDLSNGNHTFQVRAVDNAGNIDLNPASYTWVVNAVVPDTTITSQPENPTSVTLASFTFTGSDQGGAAVVSFDCQLDGAVWATCTSPKDYTGLSEGNHTFNVRAVNTAGSVDGTPASYIWKIKADTTTQVSSSANPSWFMHPVIFTATVTHTLNAAPVRSGTITFNEGMTPLPGCSALAPDSSGQATCTISSLAIGLHPITAQYSGDTEYNPSSASLAPDQEVLASADLSLSLNASNSPVIAGSDLTYTLIVANQGPSGATGISLVNTLPSSVTFKSATTGCNLDKGLVTCALGDLASGASATLKITVNVPVNATGSLMDTAQVSSADNDPVMSNNTASLSTPVTLSEVVYDQSNLPGPEWNDPITTTSPSGTTFLGEYGNQEVILTLKNLPAHTQVTVSFDLFIIRSWDGNTVNWPPVTSSYINPVTQSILNNLSALGLSITPNSIVGPDIWRFQANGKTLLNTTFSNWTDLSSRQAYPGWYPGGDYPARTGAQSPNSLGYLYGPYAMDSVYQMRYTFSDANPTLVLNFAGMGLQSIEDESWGLDRLKVTLSGGADLQPNKLYLPLTRR